MVPIHDYEKYICAEAFKITRYGCLNRSHIFVGGREGDEFAVLYGKTHY